MKDLKKILKVVNNNNTKIDLTKNIKHELKEEMNLNLDEIKYEFKYIEHPDDKGNAYGFIAARYDKK